MHYFIYILECRNGAFYTGYTHDLAKRCLQHLKGDPTCKYTRSFPPIRIAAYWQINSDLSHILKIEKLIKNLSRKEKINLTCRPILLSELLTFQAYTAEIIEFASDTHLDSLITHKKIN